MSIRLPRRRVWRVAIYLASLLLVLIAADMVLVRMRLRIHPGFETTRILGPLKDDGSIDYLTAIEDYFSDGVTPANNAAPLLLQAFGRKALPFNQPPDGITDRLGMAHLPEQGDYYVTYSQYLELHPSEDDPDPFDTESPLRWPLTVRPATVQWIEANEKPLALVTEASKRSRYFIPFNGGYRTETLIEMLIPHVNRIREARRPLLTRALLRLQAGDFEGYREDVMTVHRLARLLATAPTMVERIVALQALEIPACRAQRTAAESGKLSAQQARSMARELAAMGEVEPMDAAINVGERFMVLDLTQALARMGPTRAGRLMNAVIATPSPIARIEPPQMFHLIPIPYEESMRTMNRFYDSQAALMQLRPYPRRIAALKLWENQVQQATKHGPVMILATPDWPAAVLLPAMLKAAERGETVRMENRLAQLALGLAAFKTERGAYPAALAELAPDYLPNVPIDSFTEKPLVYARTGTGYTLYSFGPNMKDDGGDTTKFDDIVASVP